jgi:hypothetical protein
MKCGTEKTQSAMPAAFVALAFVPLGAHAQQIRDGVVEIAILEGRIGNAEQLSVRATLTNENYATNG